MVRTSMVLLALLATCPATLLSAGSARAQDRGGLAMRNQSLTLEKIEANQGCPLSSTSVTVGVNKATGFASSAQQRLGTQSGGGQSASGQSGGGPSGCRPLVSTQVVTGVNLALGSKSNAGQSIAAQGPRGVLATDTFTRGYNYAYGANSTANQRLSNQTGR
jgi:hypothetical protein